MTRAHRHTQRSLARAEVIDGSSGAYPRAKACLNGHLRGRAHCQHRSAPERPLALQMPTFYARLRAQKPAPMAPCGASMRTCGSRPTRRSVSSRGVQQMAQYSYPIKGTRPRAPPRGGRGAPTGAPGRPEGACRARDDRRLGAQRLGRIAQPGSVTVDDLFKVSTWPTLHHMVSDVHAKARAEIDLTEVILALFPGGSINGAPKIAAMQWIEHVEGLRRFYCGSLGAIGPRRRSSTSRSEPAFMLRVRSITRAAEASSQTVTPLPSGERRRLACRPSSTRQRSPASISSKGGATPVQRRRLRPLERPTYPPHLRARVQRHRRHHPRCHRGAIHQVKEHRRGGDMTQGQGGLRDKLARAQSLPPPHARSAGSRTRGHPQRPPALGRPSHQGRRAL